MKIKHCPNYEFGQPDDYYYLSLTGSSSSAIKEKHNTALKPGVVNLKTLNALTLGVWR